MREPPCRSFTISDAMVLVAATAVGMAGNRWAGWSIPLRLPAAESRSLRFAALIEEAELACLPMLAAWTMAFLFIRLRRPRTSHRRLVRQPGMLACYSALLGMAIFAVWILIMLGLHSVTPNGYWFLRGGNFISNAERIGFLVIGAWFAMTMVCGWRPIASWIDRLGRVLGLGWISTISFNLLYYVTYRIT